MNLLHLIKGNDTSNFKTIRCLPIMWKVFTGILSEQAYGRMEREKMLPGEQKGYKRQSRRTKDQLMIDKMVIKSCKRRMIG